MRILIFLLSLILVTACTSKPSSDLTRRVDTRVDLALAYIKMGNFRRAAFHLQRAKTLSHSNLRYQLTTAYYYELTGQQNKALSLYTQLLYQNKTNPNVLNNFAQFYCQQNNFIDAETLFGLGIKQADGTFSGTIYKNSGLCALKNNDQTKARELLIKAHYFSPDDPEIIYLLERLSNSESSSAHVTFWSHPPF